MPPLAIAKVNRGRNSTATSQLPENKSWGRRVEPAIHRHPGCARWRTGACCCERVEIVVSSVFVDQNACRLTNVGPVVAIFLSRWAEVGGRNEGTGSEWTDSEL